MMISDPQIILSPLRQDHNLAQPFLLLLFANWPIKSIRMCCEWSQLMPMPVTKPFEMAHSTLWQPSRSLPEKPRGFKIRWSSH